MTAAFQKTADVIKKNYPYYFLVLILTGLSIGINLFIDSSSLFHVRNIYTFGLQISTYSLAAVVIFVLSGLYITNCYQNYLYPSTLITIGVLSNFIEKLSFGAVVDYIQFFNSYINLADVMIWTGLFWLNFVIWFSPAQIKNIFYKQKAIT